MPSASCIHGSHVVDVAARRRRGISWYPSHGMRSTLGLLQPGVRWCYMEWPAARLCRGFRNLMPSLRARHAAGMGYTLQYCSQDSSRVSTDRGSLMRYMRGGAFDVMTLSKHFAPHDLHLWLRWPIRIRLILGSTIQLDTNSAYFHYFGAE